MSSTLIKAQAVDLRPDTPFVREAQTLPRGEFPYLEREAFNDQLAAYATPMLAAELKPDGRTLMHVWAPLDRAGYAKLENPADAIVFAYSPERDRGVMFVSAERERPMMLILDSAFVALHHKGDVRMTAYGGYQNAKDVRYVANRPSDQDALVTDLIKRLAKVTLS